MATPIRFVFTNSAGGPTFYVGIAEIELRSTVGGVDETTNTGGTASGSGLYGREPYYAHDDNTDSFWQSYQVATWQFDFDSSVSIVEYSFTVHETDMAPIEWYIQTYDGSDWVTVKNQTTTNDWAEDETRVFNLFAEPGTGSITLDAKGIELRTDSGAYLRPEVSNIIMAGKAVVPRELSFPIFEPEEPDPTPEADPDNDFSGHWHNSAMSDAEWTFSEQPELPIPYHKHPTKPEICGHWHKNPLTETEETIPCIEHISTVQTNFVTNTFGTYVSSDMLVYADNGLLYGGDLNSGTVFSIDADTMKIQSTTTFTDSEISGVLQIEIFQDVLWLLCSRDGYIGNWIQKVTMAAAGDDFELIGEPLYAGTVIYGTDGNVWGSYASCNLNSFWIGYFRPITGYEHLKAWEQLPGNYSYHIHPDADSIATSASGADLINFRVVNGRQLMFNNGPSSGILDIVSKTSIFDWNGKREFIIDGYNAVGGEETDINFDRNKTAMVWQTSIGGNTALRIIDCDALSNSTYSISGMEDINGNPSDYADLHQRTIWYDGNNLIYTLHGGPDNTSRIMAVNETGVVIHQYLWSVSNTFMSFEILGDYVYVWQESWTINDSAESAIIKLTLELDFVCIEDCTGFISFDNDTGKWYWIEIGRNITSDGDRHLFNYAMNNTSGIVSTVTKYRTSPDEDDSGDIDAPHNPVWDFEKSPFIE